jgi:Sec-independent protein secretion pathway component TatC
MISIVIAYFAAHFIAGVCGLWIFGVPRFELCDAPVQAAGLALASFWLMFGLGMLGYIMVQGLRKAIWKKFKKLVEVLSTLLVLLGHFGMLGAMPALWVFIGNSCSVIAPTLYSESRKYVICATVSVSLHCCILLCAMAN